VSDNDDKDDKDAQDNRNKRNDRRLIEDYWVSNYILMGKVSLI